MNSLQQTVINGFNFAYERCERRHGTKEYNRDERKSKQNRGPFCRMHSVEVHTVIAHSIVQVGLSVESSSALLHKYARCQVTHIEFSNATAIITVRT